MWGALGPCGGRPADPGAQPPPTPGWAQGGCTLLGGAWPNASKARDRGLASPCKARLFHIWRQAELTGGEVPCACSSLTQQDCFVLDAGYMVYVWCGMNASGFDRDAANLWAEMATV